MLMKWEELPFRERAEYIRTGVKNGLRSIEEVKNAYHSFGEGGETSNSNSNTQEPKEENVKHVPFYDIESTKEYASGFTNAGIFAGSASNNDFNNEWNYTAPELEEVQIIAKDPNKFGSQAFRLNYEQQRQSK